MLFLAVLIVATMLSAFAAAIGLLRWEGWAPPMRLGLVAGLFIFGVALLDELVATLRGGDPAFRRVESQREASEGGH